MGQDSAFKKDCFDLGCDCDGNCHVYRDGRTGHDEGREHPGADRTSDKSGSDSQKDLYSRLKGRGPEKKPCKRTQQQRSNPAKIPVFLPVL